MSSFIVSEETIGRAVYPVSVDENNFAVVAARALDASPVDTDLLDHLTLAMQELNERAVCERYEDARPSVAVAIRPKPCNLVQAYKSLRCWLYQCAEGDIPDTSKLYQGMKTLASLYAQEIVESSAEYEKASWD